MLRRNGPLVKSVESVLKLEGSLWGERFVEEVFAISILNVISGFAKVVVERCGFHRWIAQGISWGEVVSIFLYLL